MSDTKSLDLTSDTNISYEIDKLYKTSDIKFNINIILVNTQEKELKEFTDNQNYEQLLHYTYTPSTTTKKMLYPQPSSSKFTGAPNELRNWSLYIDLIEPSIKQDIQIVSGYVIEEILGMNQHLSMIITRTTKPYPIENFSHTTPSAYKYKISKTTVKTLTETYFYKEVQVSDTEYFNFYVNKKNFESMKTRYNGLLRKHTGEGQPPYTIKQHLRSYYPYPDISSIREQPEPTKLSYKDKETVFEGITDFKELISADSGPYKYEKMVYPELFINTNLPQSIDRKELDKFIKFQPSKGSKLAFTWVNNTQDPVLWEQSLKHYVIWLLSNIKVENQETIIKHYTSPVAMNIWKAAFTEYSYDPKQGNNYDQLEFAGDKNLALLHGSYVSKKFEKYGQSSMLSSLEHAYHNSYSHYNYALQLQLQQFIRFGKYTKLDDDMIADVFESLFGALRDIGNTKDTPTTGDKVSKTIFATWFKDYMPIEFLAYGAPKNILTETFTRLSIGQYKEFSKVNEKSQDKSQKHTTTINIPDSSRDFFVKNGIKISSVSNVIGVGYGKSKRESQGNAYFDAVSKLWNAGATRQWLIQMKSNLEFKQPGMIKYQKYYEQYSKLTNTEGIYIDYPTKYMVKDDNDNVKMMRGILSGYQKSGFLVRDITDIGKTKEEIQEKIGKRVKEFVEKSL